MLAEGKRFFSAAPIAYAAYRDNPESIWVPTSSDRQRLKQGLRSHESHAPQSGWVPTSKDKKRMETGFRSHEYVAAENHPVHLARDFAKEARIESAKTWALEVIRNHRPHGIRHSDLQAHRPHSDNGQYIHKYCDVESALTQLLADEIVWLPSKAYHDGGFSVGGNKRYHAVGVKQCDGSCKMCGGCCLGEEDATEIPDNETTIRYLDMRAAQISN
jgi:hypothetical protein